MSGASSAHAHEHADDHGGHGHDAHGSFKGYITGFVLSVILTAVPFWLVMGDVLDDKLATGVIILGLAVVQIVVHMIYFLHMNTKSEGGWTFLALIFTITIVVITLSGSIWVMHHLNSNMMPVSAEDMRHAP